MAEILIFGTGKMAELAHYYFSADSKHSVRGFIIDRRYITAEKFLGLPVTPFEQLQDKFPKGKYKIFSALGYSDNVNLRKVKYLEMKEKGYEFVSYINSRVKIYDNVTIGENCFVLEDNTIQPFVKIGNNVALWSGNHIGHHSTIMDHCFVASHAVVSGNVTVQESCFIGVNATLKDSITVAKNSIIGAGALVMKNTRPGEVYIGTRAKPLAKKRLDFKI